MNFIFGLTKAKILWKLLKLANIANEVHSKTQLLMNDMEWIFCELQKADVDWLGS